MFSNQLMLLRDDIMQLGDFVSSVIGDVVQAIEQSSENLNREISIARPEFNQCIEFDVAVTVEKSVKGSVKGSVKVVGMDLGIDCGADANGEYKSANVSRVKFGVYVAKDNKEEQEARRKESSNSKIDQSVIPF
jgi:hypothetical protein